MNEHPNSRWLERAKPYERTTVVAGSSGALDRDVRSGKERRSNRSKLGIKQHRPIHDSRTSLCGPLSLCTSCHLFCHNDRVARQFASTGRSLGQQWDDSRQWTYSYGTVLSAGTVPPIVHSPFVTCLSFGPISAVHCVGRPVIVFSLLGVYRGVYRGPRGRGDPRRLDPRLFVSKHIMRSLFALFPRQDIRNSPYRTVLVLDFP